MLTSVAEGVDVPGDTRTTADSEGVVEEPQADGHLVNDGAVVGGGLVAHAPAAVHKLQPAWKSRSPVREAIQNSQSKISTFTHLRQPAV